MDQFYQVFSGVSSPKERKGLEKENQQRQTIFEVELWEAIKAYQNNPGS
jgi:hypothetical protein